MEKKSKGYGAELVFHTGAFSCTYRILKHAGEILLEGEEAENGKTTFRLVLAFSSEEVKAVERFARDLAATQTMPRMMGELAEEYLFVSDYRANSSRNSSPSYFLE